MVYIKNWTDFETATTDLYARSPSKVRYCVKFVPKSGQLVLKVTDDVKCIKYKSHSSIILNRFESLNLRLLTQMSNTRPKRPIPTLSGGSGLGTPAAETPERGGTPAPEESVVNDKSQGGQNTKTGGGGGKKKKKGKK
ncbi:hypothetical protein I302_101355 [Kwoniella bestiolae CBS 10118]|uniref:Signal recognition particle subunit SRP9 n=1 Tax=Kwoniella bestiolae CBS 10118 TaxID=1296100 RepID=A0A1B9GC04_9TREE|nr:signal recognition particle subunit SRP9 [Kwoniella bestiolae CBS 10118]OCF28550.1 signal recognition particle subunit SRP9 [Kwoniella bestiolae CBS 10118]